MSDTIKKLADLFSKFPTIGSRTASRFVFYLIKLPGGEIDELTNTIQELKNKIKFCGFCLQPFESLNKETFCQICSNPSRNRRILCIVEKEVDLIAIESKKKYKGLYFILGGNVSSVKRDNSHLKIEELKERIKNRKRFNLDENGFSEIIIATNPTPEGKSTSVLIERALKESVQSPDFKITHLAKGIPAGGEIEYIDEETLESAFEGRK